jgi:hypothetical protein
LSFKTLCIRKLYQSIL